MPFLLYFSALRGVSQSIVAGLTSHAKGPVSQTQHETMFLHIVIEIGLISLATWFKLSGKPAWTAWWPLVRDSRFIFISLSDGGVHTALRVAGRRGGRRPRNLLASECEHPGLTGHEDRQTSCRGTLSDSCRLASAAD